MRGATSRELEKGTKHPALRPEYGRGTGVPNPIDVVGGRIRTRRLLLGMNQQALADALDLTFQQVQKYEHGANRVSASRLAAMAKILAVPISYFFADLQSGDPRGGSLCFLPPAKRALRSVAAGDTVRNNPSC